MAYIQTVSENDATGRLAELYKRVGNPDGTVDNVMKIHSINPDGLEGHFGLYVAAMHKRSPLPRAERELVGVVVSRLNGCEYCQRHHAAGLDRLNKGDRPNLGGDLLAGRRDDLTDRERAMVGFAEKLVRTPGEMGEGDVVRLREAGLEDRAIHDLAQVVAYFCYANRMVTGLGAEVEDTGIGQHPTLES